MDKLSPKRGENIHHLIIQEIEMTFPEDAIPGSIPESILIAEDEHGTVYRFHVNFQLLNVEEHRPR